MTLIYLAVSYFISVMNFLIFARVLLSWIARDVDNSIVSFVYQITEPILQPIRNMLQKLGVGGMLDFSPIVAMLLLQFLGRLIFSMI